MPSPVLCVQSNFGEVEFWQYNGLYVRVLRCFKSTLFQTGRVATSGFRIKGPEVGLSRWSARTLAGHLDIPSATVNRILRENKLQPHRLRTFTFSPDPQFGEKLLEVVALYMNPPDNAVVLCVDEKTGIQALDRTQPMLPLRATKPRSWTNEYVRHGTRTLLASLDISTGRVIAHVRKRRTSKDFLSFAASEDWRIRLEIRLYRDRTPLGPAGERFWEAVSSAA
jgi:hypothetical protein